MDLPIKINRELVAQKLAEKGISANCPSCSQNNWAFLDEAALIPQWTNIIPAPGVPVVVMVCNNCGHVRTHALGALGLLPNEEAADD